MPEDFDYLIVGAGPSGIVLAERRASGASSRRCIMKGGDLIVRRETDERKALFQGLPPQPIPLCRDPAGYL